MLAILTSHPIQYQAPLWRTIAKELDSLPFEVWFLTPHGVEPSFDREFSQTFKWDQDLLSGYQHRFLDILPDWKMNHFRGVKLKKTWEQEFKKHNITHLWVEGWRFREFWRAIETAKRLGVKIIMRGETNDLRKRNFVKDVPRRLFLKSLFNKVDRFFCIGSANRRFYQSFGIADHYFADAPYCVDNEFFAKTADRIKCRREQIRKQWGIPPSAFCFLFCGKFIPKKRVLDVSKALAQLDDRFHGIFVGSGELEPTLRSELTLSYDYRNENAYCSSTPGKASSSLVGFLNQGEIATAYVAADCLVLASDAGETWGLVVNEAMASGIPAIASDRCGSAEDLVRSLDSSFIFRCGDVKALEVAMRAVESKPPAKSKIQQVISSYDFSRTTSSLAAYLRR